MQQQQLEQALEREWQSESLRDEFLGDFQIYSAYRNAEAAGRFRIYGREDRQRS